MRRLARIAPALLGLVLAAPASALAQTPECRTCNTGYVIPPTQMPTGFRAPRLCGDCYKKYKQTGAWPGQASAPSVGYPGTPGYPGGYAMTAASQPMPPGYATVGDASFTGEPMPIGVMQTGYRPNAGMTPGALTAPMPPGHALTGTPGMMPPQGPAIPMASPAEAALLAGPSSTRRTSVLKTMLGLNGRNRRLAEQEAQRKADHARERYMTGSGGSVDSLPPSMVYGGR